MSTKFDKQLAEKLKLSRERLGFTLKEIADQMGFASYPILSSIEKGTRKVQAHELAQFAKIYLQDISYFLNEQIGVISNHQ